MSAQQPRPTLNTTTSSTSTTNDDDLSASLMPHTLNQQHQQQHPATAEPNKATQTTHNNNNNNNNITSPTSEHNPDPSDAAARAMSHTGAWKPAFDRRQSWDAQEYKHDQHRRQYMCQGEGGGFSEV